MAMGGRSEEPIDALYETGPQSSTVFFEQTDASSPDIKSGPVLPPSNWVQKVLGSAGLELICRAVVEHAGVYYREVIAEGYLSKLPPKVPSRAWRRRFFKLCVNLSTDTQEPPLTLEYYRTKVCLSTFKLSLVVLVWGFKKTANLRRIEKKEGKKEKPTRKG